MVQGKGQNALRRRQEDGLKVARASTTAEKAVNPFERKTTSKKHDVMGRIRGANRVAKSVAKARSEARKTRQKTLSIEARQHGKSNEFVDRRFGENKATSRMGHLP